MGNQLTGLSPSPVVEDYLSELSGLVVFEEELCGSRLFKVAKIRSVDGDNPRSLVAKIFPNPNISQLLWRYQAIISYITERSGVLIRDFIDQSLADRLCTRPFLCIEDKRWIAYQLLCAVDQLHSYSTKAYSKHSRTNYSSLCHGDIKAENVLITSWGWVLLADPAPFKPVWLPSDNPSEFTRFFDSSRRRVCYLAPERFVEVHSCTTTTVTTTAATTTTTTPTVTGSEATNLDSLLEDVTICSEETKNNVNMLVNECDNTLIKSITLNESNPLNKEYNIDSGKQQLTIEISDLSSSNNNNFSKSESSYLIANSSELSTQLSVTSSPSLILNTEDCDIQNSTDEVIDLKQRTKFMTSNLLDSDCHLTPSMDLFSIGRNDQSRLSKLLEQVPCEHAKFLISTLLSLDKEERRTAAEHLEQQRGKTFPSVFYTHLTPYLQNFLNPILNSPDSRISFLKLTMTNFLQQVTDSGSENLSTVAVIICNLIISVLRPTSYSQNTQTPITAADLPTLTQINRVNTTDPFNLIRNNLHSSDKKEYSTRSNRLSETGKINALICLLEIANHMQPNLLMDRVIPYCMELTTLSHSGEVRSLAIESLTHIFKLVIQKCEKINEFASFLEETFLAEYLFPNLAPLSMDPKPEVRLTLARCLPILATCSLKFLNIITKLRSESTDVKHKSPDFVHDCQGDQKTADNYLSILRLHIQERLVALLSDPHPHVRLGLMNTNGLSCLASFFGRSGTNGTLLSHMITFLNDKCKPELRAAFFRQVSPLATLTGAQFVTILRSLLEQGLIDPDDMVIEECLHCLTNLLRRRLLSAPIAVSFLTRSLALTAHPCLRIRQGSVAYITSFARLAVNFAEKSQSRVPTEDEDTVPMVHHFWPGICSPASVYARLVNIEVKKTIFRRPVNFCFTNDAVLLHSLNPPISRTVLEALAFMSYSSNSNQQLTSNDSQSSRLDRLNQILKLFQERNSSRAVTRSGETPCYTSPNDEFIDSLILKLKSLGLTELMESQLVNLSSYIVNLCQNGRPQSAFHSSNPKVNRIIPKYQVYAIENRDKMFLSSQPRNAQCINPKDFLEDPSHLQWLLSSPVKRYANLLQERLLSGRLSLHRDSFDSGKKIIVGRSLFLSPPSTLLNTGGDNSSYASANTSNTNLTKMGTIGALVHGEVISSSFAEMMNPLFGIRSTPKSMFEVRSEMPIWPESRPRGVMLANLQEHRAGMISLATHSSGRLFASCSSGDGLVKLWNCGFWPTESDGYVDQSTTGNHSSRVNSATSELVQKSSNLKNPELGLAYCLPTRSSWTFNCSEQDSTDSSIKICRSLVWTSNGSCLVTILDGKLLQQIDVATGQSNGLSQLKINNSGRAVCLKTSTCCHFPSQYNLINQVMIGGSDTNSIAYATTSNQIVARDLRVPNSSSPVWILKQDRSHGLILSMAVHSFHTWLVTGTSRGHLICWDLRYKRQIAYTEHPYQPGIGILDLQIAETHSRFELDKKYAGQSSEKPYQVGQTLIIAATDHHNEVTIWDLESSATASSSAAISSCNYGLPSSFAPVRSTGCLASTWAQPGNKTPLILDSSLPHRSVRSILCLPNNSVMQFNEYNKLHSQVTHLPAIVAGGNDARLRYWNFRKPEDSCVLVWAGIDEATPPRLTYRSIYVNDVYILIEQTDTSSVNDTSSSLLTKTMYTEVSQKLQSSSNITEVSNSAFPVSGRLELRESTKGHKNIISDLTVLQAGQAFLVSASMDGVIKIWR
ncbi:serine/threonine kinase [Schistosoma mansoni]|uniref:serine/threonine kinase n=1 Tax=Schistosoma mansoni TaxID=6183 RepID=UPI00022DC8CF|nr:serine/threonine kinase [Schistosoma mansoni]|eukprot:XP_018651160.1 serine/threonine kinase [Schistosoma mansoni]